MTSVTEAVLARRSIRGFTDRPVDGSVIKEILEVARRCPSGGNVQPWHVHALMGSAITDLKAAIKESQTKNPMGEGQEYDVYPKALKEPYRSRRYKCGEDMYDLIGIERENKIGRLMHLARNFEFFDAPTALFFSIDRDMGRPQWAHLGMFIQTVMLLANERGLDTCPQEAWTAMHKTVSDFLGLNDRHMLYCGLAIGYRDELSPVNTLITDRAEVHDFTTFLGFDE